MIQSPRRARLATAGGLALLAGLALGACGQRGRGVRIVLVTLDTARAEALEEMPSTAAFAGRGALFERAWSATSTTQPTHASLLTGLHPWQHGVTRNGEVLAEVRATLAESFRELGFETAAVVASFPLGRRFGFAQGFELFRDELSTPYARRWEGEEVEGGRFYTLGEEVTDEALELLSSLRGEKQFLWVHYFDPHDPYGDAAVEGGVPGEGGQPVPIAALLQAARTGSAEARGLVERARELYGRDLAALDRALDRLFERLDADAELFETHVVLTADHGESFGEQGCLGHGKRLVPEQLRVPLAIVSPRVRAERRADDAGSVDVAATLLALAGAERRSLPGRDLTEAASSDTAVVGMRRDFEPPKEEQLLDGRVLPVEGLRFYAVRGGRLFTGDAGGILEDDDPERPQEDARARELRAVFAGFAAILAGTPVEALDGEDVRAALQALGYGE